MAMAVAATTVFSSVPSSVFAAENTDAVEAPSGGADESAGSVTAESTATPTVTLSPEPEDESGTGDKVTAGKAADGKTVSDSEDTAPVSGDEDTSKSSGTAKSTKEKSGNTQDKSEDVTDRSKTSDETVKAESEDAAEGTEEDVQVELFAEIADDSVLSEEELNAMDFSSGRLLIVGDVIIDGENEISEYDGIHLMQYGSTETARNAYSYYYGKAALVEPDMTVSVATGEGSEGDVEEVMTESDNPFTSLASSGTSIGGSNVIALIDTGINGDVSSAVSMLGDDVSDGNGHGTRMAELIKSVNPDAEIVSIKALGSDGTGDASAVIAAIKYASENGIGIINLSVSALKNSDSELIAQAVAEAQAKGIKVVAAAGNRGMDASYFIPASIDGVITIGAADENGERLATSNFGECVDYNVIADSTSEAAAIYSALLAMGKGGMDNKLVFSPDYEVTEGPSVSLHVNFYDASAAFEKAEGGRLPSDAEIWTDGCEAVSAIEGDCIKVRILDYAEDAASMYNLGVYTDFGCVGSEKDITDECAFDAEDLTVSIPVSYKDADLTIRWYQSSESYLYATVCPDEYRAADVADKFSVAWLHEGNWNQEEDKGAMLLEINRYTVTASEFNSFNVGSTWNITAADIAYLNQYTDAWGTLSDYYGIGSPQVIGIRAVSDGPAVSFFPLVGKAGAIHPYMSYGDQETTVSGNFIIGVCGGANAGDNPTFAGGYIKCMQKTDNTAYFYVHISCSTGQDQAAVFSVTFPSKAYINLQKSSTEPSITGGNSCYSLKGAKYGVYTDYNCTNQVGTLVTGDTGAAPAIAVDVGTYYVKETEAPKGYGLDTETHTAVATTAGATVTVYSKDPPDTDPIGIKLYKTDAKTGEHQMK